MQIYLDNAATTAMYRDVADAMRPWLGESPANPSAVHAEGVRAQAAVERARQVLARSLRVRPEEVLFTSGGTEANNAAIKGILLARPENRRHVVATDVEHASGREALRSLEPLGVETTWISPREDGAVRADDVLAAVRSDTSLVVVVHGQNEYGVLQPVAEIARGLSTLPRPVDIHTDVVQSFGKVPLDLEALGVSTASLSAHKVHGPKGTGALVVRTRRPMWPLISGGGQERGKRSGTENVAGIVGFARAVELLNPHQTQAQTISQRDRLEEGLLEGIEGLRVLGRGAKRLPHIVTVVLPDVLGEVALHHLEEEGILVSQGSACGSRKKDISPTWQALGLNDRESRSTLRMSLGTETTDEEIERVLSVFPAVIAHLREVGV